MLHWYVTVAELVTFILYAICKYGMPKYIYPIHYIPNKRK